MTIRMVGLLALSASLAPAADPALTIYNQNFGVVRELIPLELRRGVNSVRFTGATAQVEPESVILRDPTGKRFLQILEQNYRSDPVSAEALLSLYEGKTIDFLVQGRDKTEVVSGKIVRAGYAFRPWTSNPEGSRSRSPGRTSSRLRRNPPPASPPTPSPRTARQDPQAHGGEG